MPDGTVLMHTALLGRDHKVLSIRYRMPRYQDTKIDTKAVSTALALPPVLGFWSLSPRVWNGRNQDAQAVQRENCVCVCVCVSSLL